MEITEEERLFIIELTIAFEDNKSIDYGDLLRLRKRLNEGSAVST